MNRARDRASTGAMRLHDLCAHFEALHFPQAGAAAHPERDTVAEARTALIAAVRSEELLMDCISHELDLLAGLDLRRTLVPFHTITGLGIGFAFGYHPPGGRPGAHEHTAWTVTAVWRNQLEIQTFDRDESYRQRQLVPKNRFQAETGRVGYIYEPCIHEPRNTTAEWSLSLHVISPRDGEQPDGEQAPLSGLKVTTPLSTERADHPYTRVRAMRQRQVMVRELSRVVTAGPAGGALLAKCHRLAAPRTRRLLRRAGGGLLPDPPQTLTRTHPGLNLDYRCDGDRVTLYAQTPDGVSEELIVNGLARDAIALAAREQSLGIGDLPGGLSADERGCVADALEESGLFMRSWQ